MAMTENGVTTTNTPGTEQYETFTRKTRGKTKRYYQYDYRHYDGKLFSCIKPTLEQCRNERDRWLKKEEILRIIAHAHGSDKYYKFSPFDGYPVITDGVHSLAKATGCYWLLDIIGSYQSNKRLDPKFQVWKLEVNDDDRAVVRGYNDTDLIITQKISYTDFPLKEIKLYLIDGVILLPSEY